MKQQLLNQLIFRLRVCVTVLILAILSLFLFSFVAANQLGDEIWKQLGLNRQQGTEGIYRSFTGGHLYYYEARNAKNILKGNRVAVAKDLLAFTKQYVNSDAFKKEYAAERAAAKPTAPEAKAMRTRAEIQQAEIAKTQKSISEMEKSMKDMDAAMKKNMMPVMDMFKKMLKEYQDPNHQYFDGLLLNEKYEKEQSIRRYDEAVKKWEKNYPENYQPIIKERLQHFLDATKDVDFDAELKSVNNLKKFVQPEYERKSTEWKQAFRAGKEVTEMARAFAGQWLAEIN